MKHNVLARSLTLVAGKLAFTVLCATSAFADPLTIGPEPTLSIPSVETNMTMAKEPTLTVPRATISNCVGTFKGHYCEATISQVHKNIRSPGKTIFVSPGYGTAENLSIVRAVTICAGEVVEKTVKGKKKKVLQCIDKPGDAQKFRLVRENLAKPCINIGGGVSGTVKLRGMSLQDVAGAPKACISGRAAKANITISESSFKNGNLDLSGIKALTIENVSVVGSNWSLRDISTKAQFNDFNFVSEVRLDRRREMSTLSLKNIQEVSVTGESTMSRTIFEMVNTASVHLSLREFEMGELSIEGAADVTWDSVDDLQFVGGAQVKISDGVSLDLSGVIFMLTEISLEGQAIRKLSGNTFYDSTLILNHTGLVSLAGNTFEKPIREGDMFATSIEDGSSGVMIEVLSGVNQIRNNRFGAECSRRTTDDNSDPCTCTESSVLSLSGAASSRTTRFEDNKVCTDEAIWIGDRSNLSRDELLHGNCVVTRDKNVARDSKTHYGKLKVPPASELIVRLVGAKRPPKGLEGICGDFLE